jgi:hypothetical protein
MFQDIGIEQGECMEVLIERGTELPHDFSCRIKPNQLNLLTLYEGNHIETKNNKQLGQYSLDNIKEGTFTLGLQISKDYKMTVLIDDFTLDKVDCTTTQEDVPLEEKRLWLKARNDYRDYIQSTLLFVDDTFTKKQLPEWEWVVEELEWAKQIMECDVSTEEYIASLHEIENKINPILQKTYHKKAFEKSPFLE